MALICIPIIKENLEFDATRDDRDKDETRTEADWDSKSVASTDMLGGKSEAGYGSPDVQGYLGRHQANASNASFGYAPDTFGSSDNLVGSAAYPGQIHQPGVNRNYARGNGSEDPIAHAPLLARADSDWGRQGPEAYQLESSYPPTYASPPRGYSPAPSISDPAEYMHAHGFQAGPPPPSSYANPQGNYASGPTPNAYPPNQYASPNAYNAPPLSRTDSHASGGEGHVTTGYYGRPGGRM